MRIRAVASLSMMFMFVGTGWASADPNALRTIVDNQCVPHQERDHDPAPCAVVNLDGGYALLKDIVGERQYLLIPTVPVPGIESAELLAPGAKDYFADAWQSRYLVEQKAGRPLPPDWLSLAVNSEVARSQNQLHIHIDCVRADVHQALAQNPWAVGSAWAPFPVPLNGADYSAIRIADLDAVNVFQLLADGIPGARDDMGQYTLVVVGEAAGGFIVFAGRADAATGDDGSGEDLQDHDACDP